MLLLDCGEGHISNYFRTEPVHPEQKEIVPGEYFIYWIFVITITLTSSNTPLITINKRVFSSRFSPAHTYRAGVHPFGPAAHQRGQPQSDWRRRSDQRHARGELSAAARLWRGAGRRTRAQRRVQEVPGCAQNGDEHLHIIYNVFRSVFDAFLEEFLK